MSDTQLRELARLLGNYGEAYAAELTATYGNSTESLRRASLVRVQASNEIVLFVESVQAVTV